VRQTGRSEIAGPARRPLRGLEWPSGVGDSCCCPPSATGCYGFAVSLRRPFFNTASAAHHGAVLDFDDLQSEKGFSATKAYSRSKLCNILFTRELASRLHGTGVTANCLHPGFVATRFGDQSGGLISRFVWVAKFFAISPEKGAKTIVHLASSSDVAGMSGANTLTSVVRRHHR
jgi:NAD(P)-dependent dehydrogenase (short-subunit alcohol dehydrogenase family)